VIEAPAPPEARRGVPRWLPPVAWAAVVFAVSSIPDLQTRVAGLEIRDKLAHFGEFFIFGWLVARSFDGSGWPTGRHLIWSLLCGAVLAALDELYQGFVPGREQDILDFLADVGGVLAGWYFSREDETVGSPRTPGNA